MAGDVLTGIVAGLELWLVTVMVTVFSMTWMLVLTVVCVSVAPEIIVFVETSYSTLVIPEARYTVVGTGTVFVETSYSTLVTPEARYTVVGTGIVFVDT